MRVASKFITTFGKQLLEKSYRANLKLGTRITDKNIAVKNDITVSSKKQHCYFVSEG